MASGRLSMRARLTLWNMGVVAVALLLFGAALVFFVERILISTIDRQLAERAARFINRPPRRGPPPGPPGSFAGPPFGSPSPLPPPLPPEPPPPFGEAQERPLGRFPPLPPRLESRESAGAPPPRLLNRWGQNLLRPDRRGGPWSEDGFRRGLRGEVTYRETRVNDEPLRVLSRPVFQSERLVGVLQVSESLAGMRLAVRGLTYALLLMVPGALILVGAGGALLTNRALRPVGDLAEAAGRIEAENLSERLPGGESRDEFGHLTVVLNGMLARLEEAFERQRRFAADASHELRTPLATIKATSSYALEDSETLPADEYRFLLKTIDGAADRATQVVHDLLFLARVGSLPVRHERVLLREVLEAARSAVLSARGAENEAPLPPVEITVDDEAAAVRSDRDHLLRLFVNLLDNAVRHTPADGKVCVRAQRGEAAGGPHAAITVTDTGEGIAPEHLARIFEPFYRADPSRSRGSGGAGLGLTICQTIVHALNGGLTLASEPGKGTTATVLLPLGETTETG